VTKIQVHAEVEARVGSTLLKDVAAIQKRILGLEDRIYDLYDIRSSSAVPYLSALFDEEEAAEPFAFKQRLAPETAERVQNKLPELHWTRWTR
jgi:hypothetical protein